MKSFIVLVAFAISMCYGHVHIMEPHNSMYAVSKGANVVIKCETFSDEDIIWKLNDNELKATDHITIKDEHVNHTSHKDHDHHDENEHNQDDHTRDHDEHHSDHDDDHDHDKSGDHNPVGEHADHHRLSTLTISSVKEEDAGTYSCYEKNDANEHDELYLSVDGKWGPERVHIHDNNKTIVTGHFHIHCDIFSKNTVSWLRDNSELKPGNEVKITTKATPFGQTSELYLSGTEVLSGEYKCKVDTVSDSVQITIDLVSSAQQFSGLTIFSLILTAFLAIIVS